MQYVNYQNQWMEQGTVQRDVTCVEVHIGYKNIWVEVSTMK